MFDISKLDIDKVVQHSFRDLHVKNFDYICLERAPEKTVKLYFFDGDIAQLPEVVNPHNHRYDFRTEVICGGVANRIFAPSTHGRMYYRFKYATPLNGGNGFTFDGETLLDIHSTRTYEKGMSYWEPAEAFHTIRITQNETVLMLTQYEDRVGLDHPTLTFTNKSEPPDLSGLYNKFTADQVIDRLRKLNERLEAR